MCLRGTHAGAGSPQCLSSGEWRHYSLRLGSGLFLSALFLCHTLLGFQDSLCSLLLTLSSLPTLISVSCTVPITPEFLPITPEVPPTSLFLFLMPSLLQWESVLLWSYLHFPGEWDIDLLFLLCICWPFLFLLLANDNLGLSPMT